MSNIKPISKESEIVKQAETAEAMQQAIREVNPPEVNKYSKDTQLPASGPGAKAKLPADLPEEVGFVSRLPIGAYVLSAYYAILMVFLLYFAYLAVVKSDSGTNLMSESVIKPSVSFVVASFLILSLMGGSKILRWTGLVVSIASLAYTIYVIKTKFDSLVITTNGSKFSEILGDYVQQIFGTDLWVYLFAGLVLVATIIYSASPKYRPAYR